MLTLLATSTCTIKRAALADGERDPVGAATVLSGLACTPPSAADVARLGKYLQDGLIQSVSMVLETMVVGVHDIQVNDIAVVDGVSHLVVAVAKWPTMPATHVTMERVLQ